MRNLDQLINWRHFFSSSQIKLPLCQVDLAQVVNEWQHFCAFSLCTLLFPLISTAHA
jgi:hypothetical protein